MTSHGAEGVTSHGMAEPPGDRRRRAETLLAGVGAAALSASVAADNHGLHTPDAALLTTAAHLRQMAALLRRILGSKGDDAGEELVDLAIAVRAASDAAATALAEIRWGPGREFPERLRADVGHAGARLARVAAQALRAEATEPLQPVGEPVPDVPRALLWLIADLSVRLRAGGRLGPHMLSVDAGVAARDAADTVVTIYRRWASRLRGQEAGAVARLALTAAYTAAFAGLSTMVAGDDDGAGCPSRLPPDLPLLEGAAAVELPCDAVVDTFVCAAAAS